MKVLRKLREKNSEKFKAIRTTPNTEDEILMRKKLKERAKRMGIAVISDPAGVNRGGGYLREGWKIEDIPIYVREKHGYDKIPKKLIGKPIISIEADDRVGKPFDFAHELGHATGKSFRKSSGDSSSDSRFRRQAEELRANINGYRILKEEGANKETLKNARKGYLHQSIKVILSKPR